MFTLALTGDVMLGRLVNETLKAMQPEEAWGDVLPHLAQADLRIANLECALTNHLSPRTRSEKMFHFRADPEAVRVLQAARIDACALANNHILDYEKQGLRDTLQVLKNAGIRHAGAGVNAADFAATAEHPGTNYLEASLHEETLAHIANGIAQMRAQGAEFGTRLMRRDDRLVYEAAP